METRANFVLIGATVLAGIAAALLFAMWIAGAQFDRSYARYIVEFEGPVRGLAKGGEVRFQGIKVGEVTVLEIDPQNSNLVLATIRIDAKTPIRTDSIGQLEPIGLTGVNLIQISNGAKGDPLPFGMMIEPGRIKGRGSAVDELLDQSGGIAAAVSERLADFEALMSEENIAGVSSIIADIAAVTARLEQQENLISNADKAIIEIRAAAVGLGEAAEAIEQVGRTAPGQIETLTASADSALKSAEAAAALAAEQSLPDVALAAQDFRRLSSTLETLALQLEANPNQLVVGAERPIVKVRP